MSHRVVFGTRSPNPLDRLQDGQEEVCSLKSTAKTMIVWYADN